MKGDSWVSFWISHQELAKFAVDVGLVNYMYLGVSYKKMTYLPVGLDGQLERGSTDRITMSRSGGLESQKCGNPKNCQWMTSVLSGEPSCLLITLDAISRIPSQHRG